MKADTDGSYIILPPTYTWRYLYLYQTESRESACFVRFLLSPTCAHICHAARPLCYLTQEHSFSNLLLALHFRWYRGRFFFLKGTRFISILKSYKEITLRNTLRKQDYLIFLQIFTDTEGGFIHSFLCYFVLKSCQKEILWMLGPSQLDVLKCLLSCVLCPTVCPYFRLLQRQKQSSKSEFGH